MTNKVLILDEIEKKVRDYYLKNGDNEKLNKLNEWFCIEFSGSRYLKRIIITNKVDHLAFDANVNKTYEDTSWDTVLKRVFDVFDRI